MKRQHLLVGASFVLNFILLGLLFSHSSYRSNEICPETSNPEVRQINSKSHIKVNTVYEDSPKNEPARDDLRNWKQNPNIRVISNKQRMESGRDSRPVGKLKQVEIHSEHEINIDEQRLDNVIGVAKSKQGIEELLNFPIQEKRRVTKLPGNSNIGLNRQVQNQNLNTITDHVRTNLQMKKATESTRPRTQNQNANNIPRGNMPVTRPRALNMQRNQNRGFQVYTWDQTWNNADVCISGTSPGFEVTTLQTQSGPTPIYIYDEISDKWVSATLKRSGAWEREIAVSMVSVFRQHQGMALIDVGANLGVFALEIAKMGRPVIAVEPLKSNMQRLCSSVQAGHFNSPVTMVYNAISDKHEKVTLGKDLNNVGGTFVNKDNDQKIRQSVVSGTYAGTVNTILLDDLLSLPITLPKQVSMKIDVEGYEVHVINGADKFFERIDVQAVFMEWTYSNNPSIVEVILNFMKKHRMDPYDLSLHINYSTIDVKSWPGTIVWRKKV